MNLGIIEMLIFGGLIFLFVNMRRQRRHMSVDLPREGEATRELRDEVAQLRADLDAQQAATAELAERVDFAERLLARAREDRGNGESGRAS